jgi:drug/metabolite transporter (DMT)-like permease
MAFLFLFFGMMCFGISNCLWRDLQIKYSNFQLLFARSIITLLILSIIYLIIEGSNFLPTENSLKQFIYSLPWILISLSGLLFFIQSVKHQASGLSGAVVLWSTLFGVLFSKAFDKSPLPDTFGLVIALYVTGLSLIDKNILKASLPGRGTLMALGAGLCWALASRGFKTGISTTNPTAFALFQEATVLIIAMTVHNYQNNFSGLNYKFSNNIFKEVLLLAFLTVGGIMGTNLALKSSTLIYFTLISAVQPATTVIISKYIQKEEINSRQIIGAGMLILGAIIL